MKTSKRLLHYLHDTFVKRIKQTDFSDDIQAYSFYTELEQKIMACTIMNPKSDYGCERCCESAALIELHKKSVDFFHFQENMENWNESVLETP